MIPDFQKKDTYVRRFQNEMMQADERRNQALFIPDKGSIVVSVVSAGQHLVIERHNVTDKQAVMDSIHAELEAWMFSGGRDGTCNVLSVDLVEPKPDQHQVEFRSGVDGEIVERFDDSHIMRRNPFVRKAPTQTEPTLTHEQVRNLRANGFID